MKTFETPVVDVRKFDVMDVLTASATPSECDRDFCDGDCPVEGTLD